MLPRLTALLLLLPLAGTVAADTPPLPTASATYQTIPSEYRLDGIVEAIKRTTVSAQTQGQVTEIHYDVDDYVEKGALLVQLRDTEHRTRVAQASAELKSATAQLEKTREEHERIKGLFAKRNVSESQMDTAEAELKAAEAALEAATAQLEQAREQLSYTEIRAPYSGIVTHRHVELGEMASPGTPIMTGVSLEELRVVVDVPQSLIPAVRTGGAVRIHLPGGETLAATDVTVFPFADMGSNTFKVRLGLPHGIRTLFPGMFVKTGFITGERRELVVPREAVVYRSEVTGVYVVDADGQLQLRQIRLGRVLDERVVVLAGLDEGERVALDPIAAGRLLKEQSQAARGDHQDG
jgi:RND family efflux transporter MFP subunit